MHCRPASISEILCAAAAVVALTGVAAAGDKLAGEQIRATVAGNTVEGTMEGSGAYAEFYQEDGTIKGDGYTGMWAIEGDAMCFQYGSDPRSCWEAAKDGDTVQWLKEGSVSGTGTVTPGNPNNY